MIASRLLLLGFAMALLPAVGCSNGAEPGGAIAPELSCTDGGTVDPLTVRVLCGTAMDATTERVDVVLGGPSSGTTTLRGFNFDLTYNPSKLEFVPATSYSSPMIPGALIVVTLSDGQQGRVVVSVQTVGGLPDKSVGPYLYTILSLSFRCVPGATFGPAPLTMENAEATGASTPIKFASGLALSYQ